MAGTVAVEDGRFGVGDGRWIGGGVGDAQADAGARREVGVVGAPLRDGGRLVGGAHAEADDAAAVGDRVGDEGGETGHDLLAGERGRGEADGCGRRGDVAAGGRPVRADLVAGPVGGEVVPVGAGDPLDVRGPAGGADNRRALQHEIGAGDDVADRERAAGGGGSEEVEGGEAAADEGLARAEELDAEVPDAGEARSPGRRRR